MRRISSRATVYYKRIFPICWFGFLGLVIIGVLVSAVRTGELPSAPLLLIPAAMMLFGYLLDKRLVSDLVDEVLDDGDALIIRNSGRQQRVQLSDIRSLDCSLLVNPQRVTLTIDRLGPFGSRVAFLAPVSFVPFTSSPIVRDLALRIEIARRGG